MKKWDCSHYEPHLDVLFERNIKKTDKFYNWFGKCCKPMQRLYFLALPTSAGEDGSVDLSYVIGVAKELGKIITDYKIIIDKSTVPVGTAEKYMLLLQNDAK